MPHFYKGYDKHLDLTEDEWLEQQLYNSMGEYDDDLRVIDEATNEDLGFDVEDEYFHGIPDEDIFGRKSWEMED